jgi:lactate dehydrogenase-like 2-hydroxyacid dehydrogenase
MGQWDAELIPLPPSVRIFASAGAGFNWADTDLLGQHKIWYANGAGASDEAVSDTAFYMIVSVFCSFTRSQLPTRTTVLEIFNATHKLIASISHNPRGYILGIIGLGGISKKLAYKARTALGMEIHCFDVVRASVDEEHRLGATFHASLDKLLKVADCISLHTPLNAYTQDLIDARALALMKAGSKVVNTARGQVVNEDALVAALKSGHISAAGLDVYYHESQVAPELAEMENVTLTAHIGRGALDTRINFEPNAMKNILAVVGPEGEFIGEPLTPVNAKAFNAP